MREALKKLDEHALLLLCKEQLPYIPTAFEELVKRYQQKVFNLCKRYLLVTSDAEDAAQEVFMKVFHALPTFDHRSTFTTWLFSIAINHCKTMLAKKQRDAQRYQYGDEYAEENVMSEADNVEQNLEAEEEKECIQHAIAKMKPSERDFILLRFSSELSLDDIAHVLGKKLSATKMGFYRALEKFKGFYEKYCL